MYDSVNVYVPFRCLIVVLLSHHCRNSVLLTGVVCLLPLSSSKKRRRPNSAAMLGILRPYVDVVSMRNAGCYVSQKETVMLLDKNRYQTNINGERRCPNVQANKGTVQGNSLTTSGNPTKTSLHPPMSGEWRKTQTKTTVDNPLRTPFLNNKYPELGMSK
jgi:hypothetical protein